jgi:hypothetical protein
MNLRDFLEQRERELLQEIADLHGQLSPKEAELAEVRRAKGSIGMSEAPKGFFGRFMGGEGVAAGLDESPTVHESYLKRGNLAEVIAGLSPPYPLPHTLLHYQGLTMKQLVVKALAEHFQHGATTRQLLDFFRDAWHRNIERQNLSPQLSRLYQEGVIGRVQGLREWILVPDDEQRPMPYRVLEKCFHDRIYNPGEIIWLLPKDAGPHHELAIERPVPDPDPEED